LYQEGYIISQPTRLMTDSRKVQRLGPSTLAITLPSDWVREFEVKKGDELSLTQLKSGVMAVSPASATYQKPTATIHVEHLNSSTIERAIIAQYVLGRRVIYIKSAVTLNSEIINAIYKAETQLMGLGVVEETPNAIVINCSIDPTDFNLNDLLTRLEITGRTMRDESINAFMTGNKDMAQRALNRENQANKIFLLLLRLIYISYQNPVVAHSVGFEDVFPLISYRSIAKNLELTADDSEDIANKVLESDTHTIDLDTGTSKTLLKLVEKVDDLTYNAVQSVVTFDFGIAVTCRELFSEINQLGESLMIEAAPMTNVDLLRLTEVLHSLTRSAGYAMRNVEIATNLSLNQNSEYVSIE